MKIRKRAALISDFLETIFVEIPFSEPLKDDNGKLINVLRAHRIPTHRGWEYSSRIRTVLPEKESYELVSTLYRVYLELGLNDLTPEVTEAIDRWLVDNSTQVKSAGKTERR